MLKKAPGHVHVEHAHAALANESLAAPLLGCLQQRLAQNVTAAAPPA
jgi:hypothetical protein